MKFIDQIRRENLIQLAQTYGGVAALAQVLERSESQVSQWKRGSEHSVTGKPRGMKSETARWIEKVTNKPPGWLDVDHSEAFNDHSQHVVQEERAIYNENILLRELTDIAKQISDRGLHVLIDRAQELAIRFPR